MGTLSSGVGLISGLDIEAIVNSLMAIEQRPRQQLVDRIDVLTAQRTAMMGIQAKVMAMQISAASFNEESVFQQKTVTTSNENIITASGDQFAAEGIYRFTVKRMASNHHFVSRAYSSLDSSIGSGTLSFEIGQGQIAKSTDLSFINGQSGFQRGRIDITDRAGNSAEIDLTTALTVQDILDEINANTDIDVTASVSGDGIVITDNTGGTGNLIVSDIGSGRTALDLGIRANLDSSVITGSDILSMSSDISLSDLNDGNGIRGFDTPLDDITFNLSDGTALGIDLKDSLHETIGDDALSTTIKSLNSGGGVRSGTFRITDRNNRFLDIDLDDFYTTHGSDATLGELKTYIENAAQTNNMDISVAFGGLDHFKITDNSTSFDEERRSNFIIEDLNGGSAAGDLGIVGDTTGSSINGDQIWFMETIGDIVNAVNNHWGNSGNLMLAINSATDGLNITDNSGGAGNLTIQATNGSMAAEDLGLLTPAGFTGTQHNGRRLIAGLNTVMLRSLNGGSGGDPNDPDYGSNRITEGGVISFTDRAGNTAQINLTDAFTVQDVLNAINDSGLNGTNIRASVNNVGHGIILEDTSTTGSGNMVVSDVASGTLAQKLGIVVDDAVTSIGSDNLQLQYISDAAQLDDLRQGRGVRRGEFDITDGLGNSATVDLFRDDIDSLADVIDEINTAGTGIRARINDTGDGLLLYDTSAGTGIGAFTVEENGGNTAHDLGILGTAREAADGSYYLDGSYEFKLDVGAADSIDDIISDINDADMGIRASLINDGSGYRISFNSEISGGDGMVYLDAGSTNLTSDTLSYGRDAILFLGDGTDEHPLLIRSSSNTIKNAINGTTLELHSASDEAVEITVEQDLDSIMTQIEGFVEAYNSLMDDLDEAAKFDPETYERGILFSDSAISTIRSAAQNLVMRAVPGLSSQVNRLAKVGVTFGSFGNEMITGPDGKQISVAVARTPKLIFDKDQFRQTFADDPEGVAELFTKADTGIGDSIAERLGNLAGDDESTIKNRLDAMMSRQKLFEKRIDHLDQLLLSKEERLYRQFYAMEQALGSMQSQQGALSSLSAMAASFRN